MSKNKGGFLFAGLLGAVAGAVGGLLLAPKSGKETRTDIVKVAVKVAKSIKTETDETKRRVKDIFNVATEETMAKYDQVKNSVITKVATLKTAGQEIDKDKYAKVVDEVITEFKNDFSKTKSGAAKLAGYLKKDWDRVKKALS